MPVYAWRIAADTPDYGSDDLSGEGARLAGGRWNRAGTPLAYWASSRSLACLEALVNLGQSPIPLNRYLVEIEIPDDVWTHRETFDRQVGIGWDALPAGLVSLDWGTSWANESRCAVAVVPSVVVPEEWCLLVNPRHPENARLTARKLRRWTFDFRFGPR